MTTPQWGYERADCIGEHALALFLDDMERVVDHYATLDGEQIETRVFQAQAAANKLLKAYANNARKTTAFDGQFIDIKAFSDPSGKTQFVPIFSTGLKQKLMALLQRSDQTTRH
ncbi:hypothetical protein [Pusillimonas sp. ANT_WB101]|uniref:hypothetical protein n=1 Tax=Pusillimonas sp. ANT_WB101 TaxID=2597356 RepID=UPI0011EDBF69|nr:hypothetical protein [Pusillimonas sp. ANT_WB101]KAA0911496.1 hypothetical protein FQ179_06635 [Pusillimonas sp. ANT_WB101]